MLIAKVVLLSVLAVTACAFTWMWFWELKRRPGWHWPRTFHAAVGFLTDFLDTLGVGSFAVTTTIYRGFKAVPDQLIPGTLNVGHTLPTIAQAFIFIAIVEVDIWTLWLLIMASALGAWLGAGVVTRLPKQRIQLGMGCALLIASVLMLLSLWNALPLGGSDLKLSGIKLLVAIVCNLIFGALMTIGVGAYAPIMVMVSLLGMNSKAAFPIMMGSCAFLMPAASWRFIKSERYDPQAALGLTLLGVPAVLVAAFLVGELPVTALKRLVVAVVVYTAITMIWAGCRRAQTGAIQPGQEPETSEPSGLTD